MKLTSPLRYPGSKSGLADYFASVVKSNLLIGSDFYEVYAGGGSTSLALLEKELISRATMVELDPLVYAFWRSVKENHEGLCKKLQAVDVSMKTWNAYQKYLVPDALDKFDILDLGLAGLFFNRTNFSGIIGAGPIGGMNQNSDYKLDCRFNKERLAEQIRAIAAFKSKFSVVNADAISFLARREQSLIGEHCLVYLDPPYYQQGRKLYRYNYAHEQHKRLAEFITQKTYPWIVSYDPHPKIKEFFAGQKIKTVSLDYAVKQSRKAKELLISNMDLCTAVYVPNERSETTAFREATWLNA